MCAHRSRTRRSGSVADCGRRLRASSFSAFEVGCIHKRTNNGSWQRSPWGSTRPISTTCTSPGQGTIVAHALCKMQGMQNLWIVRSSMQARRTLWGARVLADLACSGLICYFVVSFLNSRSCDRTLQGAAYVTSVNPGCLSSSQISYKMVKSSFRCCTRLGIHNCV